MASPESNDSSPSPRSSRERGDGLRSKKDGDAPRTLPATMDAPTAAVASMSLESRKVLARSANSSSTDHSRDSDVLVSKKPKFRIDLPAHGLCGSKKEPQGMLCVMISQRRPLLTSALSGLCRLGEDASSRSIVQSASPHASGGFFRIHIPYINLQRTQFESSFECSGKQASRTTVRRSLVQLNSSPCVCSDAS